MVFVRKRKGGTPPHTGRSRGHVRLRQGYGASLLREDATKATLRSPLYVSAKLTHRFCLGKQGLSGTATIGYTIEFFGKTVGSFWKTNPPERVLRGLNGGNWVILGCKIGGTW
jgi:hypothetical protein